MKRKGKNKLFGVKIFRDVKSIIHNFKNRINIIGSFFGNPYSELSQQAKEVARAFRYPEAFRWQYVVDTETGLKILRSEKDSDALDRVRQMADELFK